MSNLVFSTVPADGLAPLGARPSASDVMTKSRALIQYKDDILPAQEIPLWR